MGGGIVTCIYADDNSGLHNSLCSSYSYYLLYNNVDGDTYNDCGDLARVVGLEIATGVS